MSKCTTGKYTTQGSLLLIKAILKDAIEEVIETDRKISQGERYNKRFKKELESFFGSEWFDTLAHPNGTLIKQELKSQVKNEWNFDRKLPENYRYSFMRKKNEATKIKAVNIKTGETKIFNSQREAGKNLNISLAYINKGVNNQEKIPKGWKLSRIKEEVKGEVK